jgi:hypothetical protein
LNPNELSTCNFGNDKIFKGIVGPDLFPFYFQKFVKTINMRREYFQVDNDRQGNKRLRIYIYNNREERQMIEQYPNIKIILMPKINIHARNWN